MKKRNKRIRKLILLLIVTSFFLVVSTYAWFIGMKTVNVSSFDVDIASTEGLFLSMDGSSWSYKLNAKGANIATSYANNTNTWAPTGLVPVSSVGDMDNTSSRLKMYEKGSLTTTKGGYRLLTSRVQNSGAKEADGYVAFDLFIKNLSGSAYYPINNEANEEAIYLTTNSKVNVDVAGAVDGTGIENSVRVAFAQVGRVEATDGVASVANIQGITCSDVAKTTGQAQVTGICRNASIWEPNDTKHVTNAINWYTTSCHERTGNTILDASYDTTKTCGTVANNTANKTYAISREIGITDNVDVYDGTQYNKFAGSGANDNYASYKTTTTGTADNSDERKGFKLVDFPYFTDTMKEETGVNRPTFMTLAPNSITKVRVYIYIEGQDIDNYDFASLGKKIAVNFGFTKERFNQDDSDLHYSGPETNTHNPDVVTENPTESD